MHNFRYNDSTSGKFIEWSAEWDGVGESPFHCTLDYIQATARYQRQMGQLGDSDYIDLSLPGEDLPYRLTRSEIEEDHPSLIRKVNCICANNAITRAMCEMLSLSQEQIEAGYSAHTDGEAYFQNVLGCLSHLWD